MLPERYQYHITKEINRILRDIEKPSESEQAEQTRQSVWRRESDIRSELERTRKELDLATERIMDVEHKCNDYESRARMAEVKYRETVRSLRDIEEQQRKQQESTTMESTSTGPPLLQPTPISKDFPTPANVPPHPSSSSSSTISSTADQQAPAAIQAPSAHTTPAPPPAAPAPGTSSTTRAIREFKDLKIDTSKRYESTPNAAGHHEDLPDEPRKSEENNSAMREALFSHILEGNHQQQKAQLLTLSYNRILRRYHD